MDPLRVNARLVLPAEELSIAFTRSGGPGGQNVNKVATRVQLRFSIAESKVLGETRRARLTERLSSRLTREGELLITSSRHRERERNIEDARERMAEVLREALQVQKKRRATKPTRGSKKRRLDTKRQRGQVKRDRRSGWD